MKSIILYTMFAGAALCFSMMYSGVTLPTARVVVRRP